MDVGGSDDQGGNIPRSMRQDVSKFNYSEPKWWIFAFNEYFKLHTTIGEQQLRIINFNLEGDVVEWYRWMTYNKLITTRDNFLDNVHNQFGPSRYEDAQGALSKLLQTRSLDQYQSEFEKLMNHVTDILEPLLILFNILVHKPALLRELLVDKL